MSICDAMRARVFRDRHGEPPVGSVMMGHDAIAPPLGAIEPRVGQLPGIVGQLLRESPDAVAVGARPRAPPTAVVLGEVGDAAEFARPVRATDRPGARPFDRSEGSQFSVRAPRERRLAADIAVEAPLVAVERRVAPSPAGSVRSSSSSSD